MLKISVLVLTLVTTFSAQAADKVRISTENLCDKYAEKEVLLAMMEGYRLSADDYPVIKMIDKTPVAGSTDTFSLKFLISFFDEGGNDGRGEVVQPIYTVTVRNDGKICAVGYPEYADEKYIYDDENLIDE